MTKTARFVTLPQSIVDAAVHCTYECERCADVCLGSMPECARLCRDCADICWTSAAYISRGSRFIPQIVRSCIEICKACAIECEKHKDSSDCQKCAQACRRAVEEYAKVTSVVGIA